MVSTSTNSTAQGLEQGWVMAREFDGSRWMGFVDPGYAWFIRWIMLNPFKSLNCLKITFRGKRNRQDHVPWFRAQPDLGFVVAIHGSCVKHFELRHLEIGKFHEIPDDAVAYCSFPKIQKNVVGPCWFLPITVFCWGFSFGCLISQLGSLLHDLSSPDFPGKCQLSPNLTTKDKECFPKSTGRFFSWQNILLRGESGWHRFLSCAFYSWPEIHGLKRVSFVCHLCILVYVCLSGPKFWLHELKKRKLAIFQE